MLQVTAHWTRTFHFSLAKYEYYIWALVVCKWHLLHSKPDFLPIYSTVWTADIVNNVASLVHNLQRLRFSGIFVPFIWFVKCWLWNNLTKLYKYPHATSSTTACGKFVLFHSLTIILTYICKHCAPYLHVSRDKLALTKYDYVQ